MHLNTIGPGEGAKHRAKRVGRGIGSGFGKTCGRGHKGLKSRSGGTVKPGFEGGQMPIQRRLPKFGFTSRKSLVRAEVRLHELARVDAEVVTLETLQKANIITRNIKIVKVMASGSIEKAVKVQGIGVSKGARAAIEAAGGSVED